MVLMGHMGTGAVTGRAEVHLEAINPERGHTFVVRVMARIGDADLDCSRVYLRIEGHEDIDIPMSAAQKAIKNQTGVDVELKAPLKYRELTYEMEQEIEGAEVLEAETEYMWETQVDIPEDMFPTYDGRHVHHEWCLFAGLEVPGTDPTTGWVVIEVA